MNRPKSSSPDTWQRHLVAVFVAAYTTLALELLLSRFAAFYLSNDSDFLAIPLTMLGLGFGSMHVQLSPELRRDHRLPRELLYITLATAGSILAVFWIFSSLFQLKRDIAGTDPSLLTGKTLAFCLATCPPFYFCGRLLSIIFGARSDRIGVCYAADFAGAALGCLSVPLLLHRFGLEPVVGVLFLLQLFACAAAHRHSSARALAAGLILGAGVVVILAMAFLERRTDLSGLLSRGGAADGRALQLAYRWNAYSRVSLIDEISADRHRYRIIHDNAESTVWPGEFRADRSVRPFERNYITYLPFVVRRDYRDVLVMFAGVGLQMMEFDRFSHGTMAIDGVELNPTVVELGVSHPALQGLHIKPFLDLPNVAMYVEEGRQFLARTSRTYDVIYAASDAATKRAKTGHSRKYLDTSEAMAEYLRHLEPGGLLIFQSKPYWPKIEPLRQAFEQAGMTGFSDAIMILSEQPHSDANDQHHIIFKKGAFLEEEVRRIRDHFSWLQVFYAPFSDDGVPEVREFITQGDASRQPKHYSLRPTDDRPHHLRVDFAGYSVDPPDECRRDSACFGSWMKVTTLAVILLVPLLAVALLYLTRRKLMPPADVFAYLATTGCAYMLVQLVFIGKLELLFASPLYSMSILITAFLVSNAVGSALVHRFASLTPLRIVPVAMVCSVLGLLLCEALLRLGSETPFLVRVVLTLLAVGPVGVVLGLFFPMAVGWLRRVGRAEAVPMSYCVSVFASVIGASYAMTMMMNVGYSTLLYEALALYGVAAIPAYFHARA